MSDHEEAEQLLREVVGMVGQRLQMVGGFPSALCQTGDPYVVVRGFGARHDPLSAVIAWRRALDAYIGRAATPGSVLYWRRHPELIDNLTRDHTKVYSRFVVTDRSVIADTSQGISKVEGVSYERTVTCHWNGEVQFEGFDEKPTHGAIEQVDRNGILNVARPILERRNLLSRVATEDGPVAWRYEIAVADIYDHKGNITSTAWQPYVGREQPVARKGIRSVRGLEYAENPVGIAAWEYEFRLFPTDEWESALHLWKPQNVEVRNLRALVYRDE